MTTGLRHKPDEPVPDRNEPAFEGAVSLHNPGLDRTQLRPEIDQWSDDDERQEQVGREGVGALVIRAFGRWKRVDIPMTFHLVLLALPVIAIPFAPLLDLALQFLQTWKVLLRRIRPRRLRRPLRTVSNDRGRHMLPLRT